MRLRQRDSSKCPNHHQKKDHGALSSRPDPGVTMSEYAGDFLGNPANQSLLAFQIMKPLHQIPTQTGFCHLGALSMPVRISLAETCVGHKHGIEMN